jgi:hypothetical protein
MNRKMAEALATALGGEMIGAMPQTRNPGVVLTLADGRFLAIEGESGPDDWDSNEWGCAYLFPSRDSYDRYHAD